MCKTCRVMDTKKAQKLAVSAWDKSLKVHTSNDPKIVENTISTKEFRAV